MRHGNAGFSGTIDESLVVIERTEIDGVANVLGSAGPCRLRSTGSLPSKGILRLDVADLAFMASSGILEDVVLHEIGHVLGIGTLWDNSQINLLVGKGSDDPYFTGDSARTAFAATG